MKKCTRCGEVKDESEFYKQKASKDGLQPVCKSCLKNYYQQNKEKILACQKNYCQQNKDKVSAYHAQHYEQNKDKRLAYQAQYTEENRPRLLAIQAQYRRSVSPLSTPEWLDAEHWAEMEAEYALSLWCSEVMGEKYHVDHIVPLKGKKVCGLHVPWNLQVIPAAENIRKKNNLLVA